MELSFWGMCAVDRTESLVCARQVIYYWATLQDIKSKFSEEIVIVLCSPVFLEYGEAEAEMEFKTRMREPNSRKSGKEEEG